MNSSAVYYQTTWSKIL